MNVEGLKQLRRCGLTLKEFERGCRRLANTGVTAEEMASNITEHTRHLRTPLPPKL